MLRDSGLVKFFSGFIANTSDHLWITIQNNKLPQLEDKMLDSTQEMLVFQLQKSLLRAVMFLCDLIHKKLEFSSTKVLLKGVISENDQDKVHICVLLTQLAYHFRNADNKTMWLKKVVYRRCYRRTGEGTRMHLTKTRRRDVSRSVRGK